MRVRHPAGRGGRLWLIDRLDLARRATDLLLQKERVLLREERRLAVLHRRTSADWADACHEAEVWMARAAALRGSRIVDLFGLPGEAAAELVWRNSMGAFYPAEAACILPDQPPNGDFAGTAAMSGARSAHRRALDCAVQHAATRPSSHGGRTRARRDAAAPAHAGAALGSSARGRVARSRLRVGGTRA